MALRCQVNRWVIGVRVNTCREEIYVPWVHTALSLSACKHTKLSDTSDQMSVIFDNNTVNLSPSASFQEVIIGGWKVTPNYRPVKVTTAIQKVDVENNDGSRNTYTVPIEIPATLPKDANITISG